MALIDRCNRSPKGLFVLLEKILKKSFLLCLFIGLYPFGNSEGSIRDPLPVLTMATAVSKLGGGISVLNGRIVDVL